MSGINSIIICIANILMCIANIIIIVIIAGMLGSALCGFIADYKRLKHRHKVELVVYMDTDSEEPNRVCAYNDYGEESYYIMESALKEKGITFHKGDVLDAIIGGHYDDKLYEAENIGNRLRSTEFECKVIKLLEQSGYLVEDNEGQRSEVWGIGNTYILGDKLTIIKDYLIGVEDSEEYTVVEGMR